MQQAIDATDCRSSSLTGGPPGVGPAALERPSFAWLESSNTESFALGGRVGIEFPRAAAGHQHVGVQAWIPLRDRLALVPALDYLYPFPNDPLGAWSGQAWQTDVTLRVRLFNQGWLPAVGYGLNLRYAQADNPGRSLNVSSLDATDTVVFAFAGSRWRIRPHAEVYVVNVLRWA